ncbi:hypothetical protein F5I97DRAFT_1022058 [Phlebopus sp. FC_14]|nr:hypothetical protein F5I97DRAFT_1022058 [Phlebopus sp. FC_14]
MLPNGSCLPPVWTGSNPLAWQFSEHRCTGDQAYLSAKLAIHYQVKDLDTPKAWFEVHIDTIVEAYRVQHHLQKEDMGVFPPPFFFPAVGSFHTAECALFVSHSHLIHDLDFPVSH